MNQPPLTNTDTFSLFYDGACPLCQKEVRWLKRRVLNRGVGLTFIDISATDFDAKQHGKEISEFMASLHLRNANGQWLQGMEATRKIYQLIGLGWLMAPTGWPLLKPLFDRAYTTFARYRPRLQKPGSDKDSCDRCVP
ncbi:thiol-disulfide oxidoreductase DCC family protein [Oceanospirillum beijerinckii]|uniref:thiol-disulfide oxidoreductase DCC family protein n=1 Tax=Oceanospirillum beijerinckii TaxID=64976 RepID=UPI00068752B1|nr:DUF393 domain-containing protein [Oceanospirillum beijerinckii]MAC47823.1 DUF393 domain-containing protein [Oceanospirillum sp.]